MFQCDDTRDCNIQFCPPDDQHMCSKHVETWNKLIIKFSASSWLILRNKYIEMHGQQNIKILQYVTVYSESWNRQFSRTSSKKKNNTRLAWWMLVTLEGKGGMTTVRRLPVPQRHMLGHVARSEDSLWRLDDVSKWQT